MLHEMSSALHKTGLVCIIIPALNCQEALDRTLNTLSAGSEDVPFQAIVIDDGSRVPLRIPPCGADIVLIRSEHNLGIAGALNIGIQRAIAGGFEYVARLDAGDQNRPYRLTRQVEFLRGNPQISLVGCGIRMVTSEGHVTGERVMPATHGAIVKAMWYNTAFVHPTVMIRTTALRVVGGYNPRQKYAEDYELFFRIIRNYQAANLAESLVDYEVNVNQQSHTQWKRQVRWRLGVQRRYLDPTVPDSLKGFIRTLILLAVPQRMYLWLRKRRHRL